jgi:vancomycin resistance protein YoaR
VIMKKGALLIVAFILFYILALNGRRVLADEALPNPGTIAYSTNSQTSTGLTLSSSTTPLSTISSSTPTQEPIKTVPNFSFTYGQQTFTVDQNTQDSWRTPQIIRPNKALTKIPISLQADLFNFIGQAKPVPYTTRYYNYNLSSIYDYIKTLAQKIDIQTQEPNLEIQNNVVVKFTPPQTGEITDVYKTAFDALLALQLEKSTTDITVNQMTPEGSLSNTNNLGINQLIAEGTSSFKGSPNNRRHNIAAGLEKFKGLIISQGTTFSFDDNLGPVTAEAGFLPELVIDNGTTKPELGGGLCQVSTTTFRAAMQAGLPITARRNHAYAVSYYSPQGTDATIYPGSADLKFVNDTPGAILIWPYEKDANTLVFDFYGTTDGRQVTLEKPVIYDRTSDGAMKATWTRLVTIDGNTRTDVFNSNYQPPALFHKTETYVPAANPSTTSIKPPA